MLKLRVRRTAFRILRCCFVAMIFRGMLMAQAGCGVEVKVLIWPSQTEAAVAALHAGKGTAGQIYLFDTASLDLLSQGVVVRLRKGPANDLMVKVRKPVEETEFSDLSRGRENFKCEVDVVGGEEQKSYSILSKLVGQEQPETGVELLRMLSPGQKALLKQAHISIDWSLVTGIATIKSKSWRIKGRPLLNPLVLELWRWSGGQVLELSTKANATSASTVFSQVQQLATENGLTLNQPQQFKTTMVLEALTQRK